MKASSLLLAAVLSTAGLAWADHTEDHEKSNTNSQQLGRRPYSAPVEKGTTYEGNAVLEETNVKAEKNYKTLQLHMLGKRPYAEKGTD
jgi:hypothetical protein